jgi:hypothetical protein
MKNWDNSEKTNNADITQMIQNCLQRLKNVLADEDIDLSPDEIGIGYVAKDIPFTIMDSDTIYEVYRGI